METYQSYGLAAQVMSPQERTQHHQHQDIECSFVDTGNITYLMGTEPVSVSAGRWTIFWAAVPNHIIHAHPSAQLYWMTIPLSRFLSWDLPDALVEQVMQGRMMADARGDINLDKAMVKRWSHDLDLQSDDRQKIVLLELEARIRRLAFYAQEADATSMASGDEDDITPFYTAQRMGQFIAQYYTRPIGIQQVAESVDLSPPVADKLFTTYFQADINATMTRYRVAEAQRLLVTTDISLRTVATRCGFSSTSQFYEVFKSACHHTPKAYRSIFSIV